MLFWVVGLGNIIAIILFTQIWPADYIVMLIAGAAMSLAGLYIYGRAAKRRVAPQTFDAAGIAIPEAAPRPALPGWMLFRAYAPLLLGVLIVVATRMPAIGAQMERLRFSVAAWGYAPISINIFTSAGFYILVTALVCYPFRSQPAHPGRDFTIATKRSRASIATLVVGSATVYLMVDTGQIALLGKVLSSAGNLVYGSLYPIVAFLGGMAFGQGLPGDFLFSRMQVPIAPQLHIPLMVLVGIVTVVTMGPPNALKPTQIAYTASLANVKGRDGEIFRTCLPWQLLQLAVTAILSVVLVFVEMTHLGMTRRK